MKNHLHQCLKNYQKFIPITLKISDQLLFNGLFYQGYQQGKQQLQQTAEQHPIIYLKLWLGILTVQGFAKNSIIAYERDVRDFLEHCEKYDLALLDIESSDIRDYLRDCVENKKWSNTTIQRVLSSIRQFMQWLVKQQFLQYPVNVKFKRPQRALPGMLSVDQVNQFLQLDAPEDIHSKHYILWLRDTAMFELLYASGLRVSELVNLKIHDIDWSQQHVRVLGKGNKQRQVPFGSKARQALIAWLDYRKRLQQEHQFKHDFVFISNQFKAISVRQVQYRIKQRAIQAGLGQDIYPHLLRHCFATHILSHGGELRTVQEMLGHEKLSTTQVYTHLNFKALAEKYHDAHPRAKRVVDE
ncbi:MULTISPECIES: tyrosine-type recombinase/integrase [unclassified Acinetobacter]|uniref:tyrosine-type recombinase/integrase n=1 Tax=unclassified Acinetobacter TaxID=196816 RepID=UPI0035B72C4A